MGNILEMMLLAPVDHLDCLHAEMPRTSVRSPANTVNIKLPYLTLLNGEFGISGDKCFSDHSNDCSKFGQFSKPSTLNSYDCQVMVCNETDKEY